MILQAVCLFAIVSTALAEADSEKQRYAVLKSFAATGTKNVRWETMPLSYADANGKPIGPQKAGGKKQADGTTTFGCMDMQGKERTNGEEYERPNGKFKYRCNNGIEEVAACVGSERTNKAVIPVGQSLDVNGFWHKCQSFPNGSVVYTQASSCKHGDKEYKVGEDINVGYLRLQCQDNGYKVIGCFYLDENNNVVSMNSGETKEAGKVTHYCEEKGDTLQYFSKPNGCTKQGKEYKEGDTFNQNHLSYKCTNGLVDITGCYIDEQRPLTIGQDVVENNMAHRCYRLGGKIEYSEYGCGTQGTPSCTLEPIPDTPDDAPTLARGLQAPGFGSFALAQKVGGGQDAANPNTMKLELDKLLMAHSGVSH